MWWYSGEMARSWEGVMERRADWIGRDLEVKSRGTTYRGPVQNLRLFEVDMDRTYATSHRAVIIELAWCMRLETGFGRSNGWEPTSLTEFSVNVTRNEDFQCQRMRVDRDGGMELYLWCVGGYRFLPPGDKLMLQAA